jgi:hypothetical protein
MRYPDLAANVQRELLVEGVRLVILKPRQERGAEANLLGFGPDGERLWHLEPPVRSLDSWDGFVNLWVREGQVWAGSWSGFSLRINPCTGDVIEQVFTK